MSTITYDEIKRFDSQYQYWSTAKELAIKSMQDTDVGGKPMKLRKRINAKAVVKTPKEQARQKAVAKYKQLI